VVPALVASALQTIGSSSGTPASTLAVPLTASPNAAGPPSEQPAGATIGIGSAAPRPRAASCDGSGTIEPPRVAICDWLDVGAAPAEAGLLQDVLLDC
jgi:hypothetical protein